MKVNDGNQNIIFGDRKHNNFDFLRLVGAILVIFYTSSAVLGNYTNEPIVRLTHGYFTTGNLGVAIFFIISGYLITKSWDQRRNIVKFVWARFLRLVPALVGVALFTIFIIGPLTTHQNIIEYFTNSLTWGYLKIVTVFFPTYSLPGVFIHNSTDKVNGALWTLPIESTMYLVILIIGALGILKKKRFITLMTLLVLGLYLYVNIHVIHAILPLASNDIIDTLKYYANSMQLVYPLFFLIGSMYYLYKDKIKFDMRFVLLASIILVLSFWGGELILLTLYICLPYIVLGLAFNSLPMINGIGKRADISYGLYIYHFPVQQTLVNFFRFDSLTLFVISLIITVPLAWLSWHLIENKALSLKNVNLGQLFNKNKALSRRMLR